MDSIKHSEFGWLFKLLEIYQTGDVAAFHKEMPSGTGSELLTDRAFMEQKMAIFALMRVKNFFFFTYLISNNNFLNSNN